MIIRELIIDDDNDELGVYAVSLVSNPAIETNFLYFNKEIKLGRRSQKADEAGINLDDWWVYTAEPKPDIIDTSRHFCKMRAGNVYHISEINSWSLPNEKDGFIVGSNTNYFTSFEKNSLKNVDNVIYGCRHYFRRVRNIQEIPSTKLSLITNFKNYKTNFSQDVQFKIVDSEKMEIEGVAMISGKMIYRNNINGKDGYVYFSRDTVRKIKEKYGFNRTITIEHEDNITGTAILMESRLIENNEKNTTEWRLRYKILNTKLWEVIKDQFVVGFSIKGFFEYK